MKRPKFVRAITQVIALFLFCGCTHLAAPDTGAAGEAVAARPAGAPFDLFYVSTRAAYMEPCGCSLRPLGGIRREWNAVRKYRDPQVPSFYLEGGTTFVPGEVSRKEVRHFARKAKYILEALNGLGLTALSPSAEDFTLGTKEVRALAKSAKFPFVSANLLDPRTRKPHFARYLVLEASGIGKVLITGLSGALAHQWARKDVKVADPVASLRAVFKEAGENYALIVLISGLPSRERTRIQQTFPRINVVLGGDATYPQLKVNQEFPSSLHIEPAEFAKVLVHLRFGFAKGWQAPVQPYNPGAATDAALILSSADNQLHHHAHELTLKLTKAERAKLLREKRELEAYSSRLKAVQAMKPGPVQYTGTLFDLDESYEEPLNPMQQLYDRYLETVHQASLAH